MHLNCVAARGKSCSAPVHLSRCICAPEPNLVISDFTDSELQRVFSFQSSLQDTLCSSESLKSLVTEFGSGAEMRELTCNEPRALESASTARAHYIVGGRRQRWQVVTPQLACASTRHVGACDQALTCQHVYLDGQVSASEVQSDANQMVHIDSLLCQL